MSIELLIEHPKYVVRIRRQLRSEIQRDLMGVLRGNVDLFAWRPEDVRGIDPEVAMHMLNIKPYVKLVKQQRRHFGVHHNEVIEKEVEKLLKI